MKSHSIRGLGAGLVLVLAGCSSSASDTQDQGGAQEQPQQQQQGEAAPAEGKCPMGHGSQAKGPTTNSHWWPNQLDLSVLHHDPAQASPFGAEFDYAAEFAKLDLAALRQDIKSMLTTSQAWWPADYGHYGPLFIRLAWHSAGTYRVSDGRGGSGDGTIRFAPLNSWPDNANLDKARRLLWPIKQKYGRAISWADLMVFTGNVALEDMGFQTFGFAGGREDVWEPEQVDWGAEREWLADQRHHGQRELEAPLAATQMGLIYVNPEGPKGKPDPLAAAHDIRATFRRMAMSDEETVALIAGGHTLGKAHGAAAPGKHVGAEPAAAPIEAQGLGWRNSYASGKGAHTITSGLEGAWTATPVHWSHDYFTNLYSYEWELHKGQGGAWQWQPQDPQAKGTVPDAHDAKKSHAPMMFTTDLALRLDPEFGKISKRFYERPKEFDAAFARAWYKLTHRDMGPHARLLGPEVPAAQLWQDPVPAAQGEPIDEAEVAALKEKILASGLSTTQLVSVAWASASTFRQTDLRGGANGARIRLAPQKDWAVNQPQELAQVLAKLGAIQQEFNGAQSGKQVSLADLIVLGGAAAIEAAAEQAGHELSVPFRPGRTDATQAQTDVSSFAVLEPQADGFRNYVAAGSKRPSPELLVERARLLALNAPELTALVGGLRVLGVTAPGTKHGVLTARPGALSNDFFKTLLTPGLEVEPVADGPHAYQVRDPKSGKLFTATAVDLVFGSNSQLRALAEAYASADGEQLFLSQFVAAWTKVMEADRFDAR